MQSTYDKIWASALKSISARMMSRADLARKLRQKFPDEEGHILKILDEMERVQLVNDKRYCEQLIDHLIQRNIGRLKIRLETRKRGLDSDLVESTLMNSDYNEEEWVKKALAEKEKTLNEENPRKRKQKLMMFLQSRGFTNPVIYGVLR